MVKDYYTVLGLGRNASSRAIRKKTLALGRHFHPDKQKTDILDEPKDFIAIVEACEVLYDNDARTVYHWLVDHQNGTDTLRPPALEKHRRYIAAVAERGKRRGAEYARLKFREFKEDYRVMNWWDVFNVFSFLQHWS